MCKIEILARSILIPEATTKKLNDQLESLSKTEDAFVDTCFYELTEFRKLQLVEEFTTTSQVKLQLQECLSEHLLLTTVSIQLTKFDLGDGTYDFQFAIEQAVLALIEIAQTYDLSAKRLAQIFLEITRDLPTSQIPNQIALELGNDLFYKSNIPNLIPIKRHENQHSGTHYIGHYGSGNQFWAQVAAGFRPPAGGKNNKDWESRKCWYAILHKFNSQGDYLSTNYKFTGTTADGESKVIETAKLHMDKFIEELGAIHFGDIAIKLFNVDVDEHVFGLIDTSSAETGDSATMMPGDLVFFEPWKGEYDT